MATIDLDRAAEAIRDASSVALACHVGPDGDAHPGPLPLVLVLNLGDGDVKTVAGPIEDRADDSPLLLQRVDGGQMEIESHRTYVRGISRSS